jgi:hypothetical protein
MSTQDLRRAEEEQAEAEADYQLALHTHDDAVIEKAAERMKRAREACDRIRREQRKWPS